MASVVEKNKNTKAYRLGDGRPIKNTQEVPWATWSQGSSKYLIKL